jgi:diguanylate cyclase (GGDEF)-like protein/hemerythrin-like metal-binding protein/PAS domain S-box-containing protein
MTERGFAVVMGQAMTAVMGRYSRFCLLLIGLIWASISIGSASAAEPVRIGVLAFRPKPQTLAQWQPLAAALQLAVPGRTFVVEALSYPEMESAVAGNRLDFVLTNPGHYVLLARRLGLTAPLATLAMNDHGHAGTVFGGVIFTRSDRAINSLEDIKGRSIAVTDSDSLGGFQMQAYELSLKGIRLPQDAKLIVTGMPHDNVIEAVLSGRADVGFVRTGVMESLGREGKGQLSQIRTINPQTHPDFTLEVSTRLYPEWPFASMPGTDENLARHVAAALFVLEENKAVTRAMGIHGFVVPADYTPVADLLKELRMPPFDEAPEFVLQDVWERYRWQLTALLLMMGLVISLAIRLILVRRKLESQHRLLSEQKRALLESESHLQTVIKNEPECIKIVDAQGLLRQMNPAGLAMIEADSLEQVSGHPVLDFIAPAYRQAFADMHKRVLAGETVQMEFEVLGLKGGRRWQETHAVPMPDHGNVVQLAVTRDITERKKMEDQIRQLAFYDPLTKLPNRRLLNDRMDQAIAAGKRKGHYAALMFMDLDNFKPLNDMYGHDVGDLLLVEVAHRIGMCVRETDTVARFGGDEFVVMLAELDGDAAAAEKQARSIAEKIRSALSAPYRLTLAPEEAVERTVEHWCTASIGVVIFDYRSGRDDVFKRADMAMYDAKSAGRNRVVVARQSDEDSSGTGRTEGVLRLIWHDSYDCGEATIDREHRKLFELANKLIESAFAREENHQEFETCLTEMFEHLVQHFADEEAILARERYIDLDAHILAHKVLLEHALRLRNELGSGSVTVGALVNFIADDVVSQHMLKTDRNFYPIFASSATR